MPFGGFAKLYALAAAEDFSFGIDLIVPKLFSMRPKMLDLLPNHGRRKKTVKSNIYLQKALAPTLREN